MNTEDKQHKTLVYRHRRLDTNKIFYIGIGTLKRAYTTNSRNIHWKRIVNKTKYEVEILQENLDWDTACELEIFLIELYGRVNSGTGILCNLTDGGDGQLNIIRSEETKQKLKQNHARPWLGRKHSKETLNKQKEIKLGNKNPMFGKSGKLSPRSKEIIDLINNITYYSIKNASEELQVSVYEIKRRLSLKDNEINKLYFKNNKPDGRRYKK